MAHISTYESDLNSLPSNKKIICEWWKKFHTFESYLPYHMIWLPCPIFLLLFIVNCGAFGSFGLLNEILYVACVYFFHAKTASPKIYWKYKAWIHNGFVCTIIFIYAHIVRFTVHCWVDCLRCWMWKMRYWMDISNKIIDIHILLTIKCFLD